MRLENEQSETQYRETAPVSILYYNIITSYLTLYFNIFMFYNQIYNQIVSDYINNNKFDLKAN